MFLAFACQSIFAAVANEYVDEVLQYVHVFVRDNDLKEVNIGGQYSMGNFETLCRTGDISLDYDLVTGGITVLGNLGLGNLYVKSSDGRQISSDTNSFYMNMELILAAEPVIAIHEFRTESLICKEHGRDISINFPKNDAMGESDAIGEMLLALMNDSGSVSLRQEDIDFLENLLNGEYCSPSIRKGNTLGNTLGSSAISDFRQSFLERSNEKMAQLSVIANTLISNAISDRMTSVKGCLSDPFIHAIYGHAHQNEIAELGYNNNMGGLVIGLDNVWTFTNERYLRLGAAFGYVHGKTNFFGSAALGRLTRHDAYTLALFGAYESFNDKRLKTNIGAILGCCYGKDRLSWTDSASNTCDGKFRSDNIFIGLEFIKNLYAHKGYQFGLWLRANYGHIAQKEHDEATAMGVQHVSSVNHNLLTTVVGINVEKEIFNQEHADDKKLTLSLRAGWECQAIRKHSDITITFDDNLGIGEYAPTMGRPSKNAAIVFFGAVKKLNTHWNIVGSYIARFNKNISSHNLSCGVEYFF
jgi:outer membrane autotransporter protein